MSVIEGVITAEIIGAGASGIVYRNGKAKIFNVLESILSENNQEDWPKLQAYKRIVDDILSNIAKDVNRYVVDMLGDDLEIEVETDDDAILPPEEAEETMKEFEEIKKILA